MATTTIRLRLPRLHQAQRQIEAEARRFNVVACGRRFGKTKFGIHKVAQTMLAGGVVGWFAASTKIEADAWREIKETFRPATRHISEQEMRLEVVTGGVLEMWSLGSEGAGRSRKYHRIIVDEGAHARTLKADWDQAIRPTLSDYQGDGWFLSSPNGREFFWMLWQRGQDPAHPDWASWRFPTAANPYIRPEEIASARQDMPERTFMQEYLAEFLEFEGAVFRRIREAAVAEPHDVPLPNHDYVMGVDWGKLNDFTVITVIDATAGAMVAFDRFNQIDYAVQTDRLQALYERFRPETILAEHNSIGVPLIEQLQRQGLPVRPFTTTNATKAEIVDGLALAFERGELAILPDPVLMGELAAFEATRLPSGLMRYGAPEGFHDDCVMSLALAWQAAAREYSFVFTAADLQPAALGAPAAPLPHDPNTPAAARFLADLKRLGV